MRDPLQQCEWAVDAVAFVAGELMDDEARAFAAHSAHCTVCRKETAEVRGMIAQLRSIPREEVSHDLTSAILARVRAEAECSEPASGWSIRWWQSAAAVLAIIAGSLALWLGGHQRGGFEESTTPGKATANSRPAWSGRGPDRETGLTYAVDWFCRTQESDGSWDPEKWGGHGRFKIALTALPAVVLLRAEVKTPAHAAAANRAVIWLQNQQNPNGTFGPEFQAAPYNDAIATLALLCAQQKAPNPTLKRALDRAVATLASREIQSGGWGYLHSPFVDRSITEWHIETLELALALGWNEARPLLDRGQARLAASRSGNDAPEPADSPSRTLPPMLAQRSSGANALDFYRTYFIASELRLARDESSKRQLAAIRGTLLRSQTQAGPDSGSWPASDRWGQAGGRLYSTALASLALD